MAEFQAGLNDQDDMSQFPSAANPLSALGLDPDMVRANPELLAQLGASALGTKYGDSSRAAQAPKAAAVPDSFANPQESGVAPEAAQAPAPKTATDYGMAGLASLNQNARMATDAAAGVPGSSPEVERLAAQRAKLATAAPLYNPQSGKMLDQTQEYDPTTGQNISINPKASTGRKIWRGVRGGLMGLATGGIPGAIVGALDPKETLGGEAYGAPSGAYQKAETRRQEQLASTDASLGTAFKNWQEQVNASKARASEFRANATLGKDETTGSTEMQNAATRASEEKDTAARNAADSPEAKSAAALKLNQQQFEQRQQRVAQMRGVSPLNQMLYMLNGKVPDPREPNEAEVTAAQAARALVVFKAQHGGQGPQTLEDFNAIQASARGNLDRGQPKVDRNADEEVSSIVAEATGKKNEFVNKYTKLKDGSYMRKDGVGGIISPQEFATQVDQFRADANVKLAKKGAQVDAQGNVVRSGGAGGTVAQNAPPKVAAAPDGTRRQAPDGTVEIKNGGRWVKE